MIVREVEPNRIEVVNSFIPEMGYSTLQNNAPVPAKQKCNKFLLLQLIIVKSLSNIHIHPVEFIYMGQNTKYPKWLEQLLTTNDLASGDFNTHHSAWDKFTNVDPRG